MRDRGGVVCNRDRSLCLAMTSPSQAVDARLAKSLLRIDLDTRLKQMCDIEAMHRIGKGTGFVSDRAKSDISLHPIHKGDSLSAPGVGLSKQRQMVRAVLRLQRKAGSTHRPVFLVHDRRFDTDKTVGRSRALAVTFTIDAVFEEQNNRCWDGSGRSCRRRTVSSACSRTAPRSSWPAPRHCAPRLKAPARNATTLRSCPIALQGLKGGDFKKQHGRRS